MVKNRHLYLLLGLLVFMLLAAACSSKQPPKEPDSAKSADTAAIEDTSPIVIGYIAALSGPASELGIGGRMAVELAVEQVNAAGGINGHPIELIVRDDQYNPTTAVNLTNEMINKHGVQAIIGPTGSSIVQAVLPVTKSAGVPHFINLAQNNEFTEPAIPNAFRFAMPNWVQTKAVADFVNSRFNKVGIITDTSAYGTPGGEEVMAHLKKSGQDDKVVGWEKYNPKDLDMTPQLLRLKNAGAQVLVLWGLGNDAATIKKNMKDMGYDIPVIGANALVMKNYRDLAGELVKGTYTTYNKAFLVELTPEAEAYANAWRSKYPDDEVYWGTKEEPGYYLTSTVQTYDAANVLFAALRNAKSFEHADIIDALNNISSFKGVNGTYEFSADDHEALGPEDNIFVEILPDNVAAVDLEQIK